METFTKKTGSQYALSVSLVVLLLFVAAFFQHAIAGNRFNDKKEDYLLPVHVTATSATIAADYPTLADAFAAINNGIHAGVINILIDGNTTEGTTAALNESGNGSASYSAVTINPSGNIVISGDIADAVILLNGADNITIDGINTSGNSLTIQNINTGNTAGTSTIKFIGDATFNNISNCSILGSATVNIASGDDGANIWFASGVTTGNDNNTISNCNIAASVGGLPVRLIESKGATTSATVNNSGNTISNCNLSDCFSGTAISRMIDINAGSTDITITGNNFFQTDVRTQTTGAECRIISISNTATGNNFVVNANTIGYSNASASGIFTMNGTAGTRLVPIYINVASGAASAISNNNITAISLSGSLSGTLAAAPFCGIQVALGLVNITGNIIGASTGNNAVSINSSGASATDVCGIYTAASAASVISANTLGSIVAGTSANATFNLYGIRANINIAAAVTISNNTIGSKTTAASFNNNSSLSTSARVIAIQNDASSIFTINGNTIANISSDAQNASGNSPAVVGIRQAASSSVTAFTGSISNDTIYAIGATDPLAGVVVAAMHLTGSTAAATAVTVSNNSIHTLTDPSTNSFAELRGIYVVGGKATYQDNMIGLGYDASGASLSNNLTINGVYETGGTNNFYFNTIYIGGTGVNGANKCYALRSLTTGVTRNYKNNIFQNSRSGSGKYYAIQLSGTGTNPSGLSSANNKFFADGTGGILGIYAGSDKTSLTAWQSATGQDALSVYANPGLKTPAGSASSIDLHVDIYAASSENDAVAIPGITTDFDGDLRNASTPDIGADEYSLSACTGANGGVIAASVAGLCNSGSANLSASGFSNGTSSAYTWEYSSDNFTSDFHNLAPSSLYYASASSGTINTTTYYRLKVACAASLTTAYSNIVAVNVSTVNASINASAANICAGSNITLTENGGTAISWSWNNGAIDQAINVSPAATTIYSVTTTNAAGCSASSSVTIVVNPLPASVSASASASSICAGNAVNLFGNGNSANAIILSENFNGVNNTWTKINNSVGGDFANAAWALRPDGYNYAGTNATFHSNDNSQFYLSNSDEQGAGVSTETILVSPSFSLTGYTDVNLSYYHHFSWFSSADFARVEISNDNGATWTALRTWTSDQGTESSFVNDAISLNAYMNQLVKIRFRYNSDFGDYWAIDNVSVTGTPSANMFAWSSSPAGFASTLQNPTNVIPVITTTYNLSVTSAAGCTVTASTAVTVNANITYYQDHDGDGYGNPNTTLVSCTGAPSGYVADNTDCNDNASTVHPGAVEICGNGIDDNCNGQIDEGCTVYTFYRDQDEDTYGNAADFVTNSTGIAPVGYVSNSADCNDNASTVNPGAVEICGNGIDDNCNGQIDEGCTVYTFYRDQDGDTYGNAANSVTNSTGIAPVGYVSNNTDCNDNNINVNPGAVEICGNGIDDNCNGQIDETTLQASSLAGTITCVGGTTTVTVSATGGSGTYTGTGLFNVSAGTYNFTVKDTRNCSSVTSGNVTAGTGTAPARPAAITGTTFNLCGGGNFTYTVKEVATATSYTWTVPSGFSVVQNNGRSALISVPASFNTAQISVRSNNTCGSSAVRNGTLYAVAPNPSSSIKGSATVTAGQANVTYSLPAAAGITYTWSVPTGASITSGQGTNRIRVKFGSTSGNITVVVSNACGVAPTGTLAVKVNAAAFTYKPLKAEVDSVPYLKAYPNPAQSISNISFNSLKADVKYDLVITDLKGQPVFKTSGMSVIGENNLQVNVSAYANAMYIVKVITDTDVRTVKLYKEK